MWGKIIIPMYRLWLNGLYGLYGPRCPLFSKRPINLISLSPGHHCLVALAARIIMIVPLWCNTVIEIVPLASLCAIVVLCNFWDCLLGTIAWLVVLVTRIVSLWCNTMVDIVPLQPLPGRLLWLLRLFHSDVILVLVAAARPTCLVDVLNYNVIADFFILSFNVMIFYAYISISTSTLHICVLCVIVFTFTALCEKWQE